MGPELADGRLWEPWHIKEADDVGTGHVQVSLGASTSRAAGMAVSGSPAPALGPLPSNKGDQVPLLMGMRPLKGSPCLMY